MAQVSHSELGAHTQLFFLRLYSPGLCHFISTPKASSISTNDEVQSWIQQSYFTRIDCNLPLILRFRSDYMDTAELFRSLPFSSCLLAWIIFLLTSIHSYYISSASFGVSESKVPFNIVFSPNLRKTRCSNLMRAIGDILFDLWILHQCNKQTFSSESFFLTSSSRYASHKEIQMIPQRGGRR